MDWMSTLEVVVDRIDTLECHNRLYAQSIAREHEAIGSVSAKMSATSNDIGAYKTFIGKCHENMDLVLTDRFRTFQAQIDSATTFSGPTVGQLESRMRDLEFALARALSLSQEQPRPGLSRPDTHQMATLIQPPQDVPSPQARDPWAQYAGELRSRTLPRPVSQKGPATATTL